jgi:hypothetical protein
MSSNLASKILQEIEDKKIQPKSKSEIYAKRILLWVPAIIGSCVGGLGLGVLLFQIIHGEIMFGFAMVLVLLWVLLTLCSVLFAKISVQKTRKGYRFTPKKVFIWIMVATMVFGFVSYFSGVAKVVDDSFDRNFEIYEGVYSQRYQRWSSPVDGRLAGKIISLGGDSVVVSDRNAVIWEVEFSTALKKSVTLHDLIDLRAGEVKARGFLQDKRNHVFVACTLGPLTPVASDKFPRNKLEHKRLMDRCETN